MNQDRLSDLGMLAIENEIAREVDYSNSIDHFAQKRPEKSN